MLQCLDVSDPARRSEIWKKKRDPPAADYLPSSQCLPTEQTHLSSKKRPLIATTRRRWLQYKRPAPTKRARRSEELNTWSPNPIFFVMIFCSKVGANRTEDATCSGRLWLQVCDGLYFTGLGCLSANVSLNMCTSPSGQLASYSSRPRSPWPEEGTALPSTTPETKRLASSEQDTVPTTRRDSLSGSKQHRQKTPGASSRKHGRCSCSTAGPPLTSHAQHFAETPGVPIHSGPHTYG